jgi:Ras-related protein Rab-1A
MTYDHLCRVIITGDAGVGKSSLMVRFSDDQFSDGHITTIGVDFRTKLVTDVGGHHVKVQIWDTAGQERYRSIVSSYYRGAHAVIVVYDVTNRDSFDSLQRWLSDARRYAQEGTTFVIVGNKQDSADQVMAVSEEDARKFAAENDTEFMLTSAKSNTHVDELFHAIVRQYLDLTSLRKTQQPQAHVDVTAPQTSSGYMSCGCSL